ncbi:MOB kinase activator-like 1A [Hordeum vulgare]|nr:MOB kinase activator-like 1A [Hordeum vulgare]
MRGVRGAPPPPASRLASRLCMPFAATESVTKIPVSSTQLAKCTRRPYCLPTSRMSPSTWTEYLSSLLCAGPERAGDDASDGATAAQEQSGQAARNQKTFRPKKSAPSGSKGAQLRKHIDATLGSGNLREAVRLPPGEDINEWLAVNTVDFFNQVNLLYGTLTEFCTSESCPTMTAGPKYEYRWADGVQIKKPIEVSAPKYVEYLMDWIEGQLDNESLFPQKLGTPFPPNFKDVVNTIFKRLFRVYAHIYHSHFQKIVSLKEEAHLNTCFKHFILFTNEFGLIDKKELAPLQELIESIIVPY